MAHEVPYGKVVGRFLMPVAVDSNADAHLEPTPAAGTVTFTPSVKSIQFFDLAEPVTITPTSVTVTLDAEGYIVDSTGARGVSLVATENPGAIPASATYKVKTAFAGRGGGRTFSINVPVGGVVDLAVAAPPLPGVAIAPTVIEDIIQTRTIATDAATAASGSATQAAASATEAATQAGVVEGVALDKIAAINSTAGLRVAEVNSAGAAQVTSVQGAGDQELADIAAAGAAKVGEVNTAGAARLSEVNTAGAVKVAEVNAAGAAEVANLNTLDLILTAETGAPGTEVQATTSGTFPNIGVDLRIPRGDQGFERFLVESGGVYPARNFTGPAVFIGASNPDIAGLMVDGDTWINSADDGSSEVLTPDKIATYDYQLIANPDFKSGTNGLGDILPANGTNLSRSPDPDYPGDYYGVSLLAAASSNLYEWVLPSSQPPIFTTEGAALFFFAVDVANPADTSATVGMSFLQHDAARGFLSQITPTDNPSYAVPSGAGWTRYVWSLPMSAFNPLTRHLRIRLTVGGTVGAAFRVRRPKAGLTPSYLASTSAGAKWNTTLSRYERYGGAADDSPQALSGTRRIGATPVASETGSGWRYTNALFLEGTGSPEAVVAAPVGSRYIDTAATNGAIEWIKASGTAKTGWRVAAGEVARDVKSVLGPGFSCVNAVKLHRSGDTCALYYYQLNHDGSAAGNVNAVDLPLGFRPYGTAYFKTHDGGSGYVNNAVFFSLTGTAATSHRGHIVWTTRDPWPTILPGAAG